MATTAGHRFQECLGEAGRFLVSAAAVAGGEEDERGGMAGVVDVCGDFGGAGGNGIAVFVFEFEDALVAVAGEVEHVVAAFAEGGGDLVEAADFEDAHEGVVEAAGGFDGVEDGLQFALDVEDGVVGLVLVGSADGDQNLQGAGRRGGRGGCGAGRWGQAAPGVDTGEERRDAAAGELGGFEGNAEETGERVWKMSSISPVASDWRREAVGGRFRRRIPPGRWLGRVGGGRGRGRRRGLAEVPDAGSGGGLRKSGRRSGRRDRGGRWIGDDGLAVVGRRRRWRCRRDRGVGWNCRCAGGRRRGAPRGGFGGAVVDGGDEFGDLSGVEAGIGAQDGGDLDVRVSRNGD